MQGSSWQRQQCTTMGCWWPWLKKFTSKKEVYPIKRKYKANLKRRWQRDVSLEMLDRENRVPSDAR